MHSMINRFCYCVVVCGVLLVWYSLCAMLRQIHCALLLLLTIAGVTWGQFAVPEIKLYALSPRGFRAELPDQAGIELFAFHGQLNQKLAASKQGSIAGDVTSPTDGKWVFEDPDLTLAIGDKIYYWYYVQYNKAGYSKRDQIWEVTQSLTYDTSCAQATTVASNVGTPICAGKLILEDDFNQPTINSDKWIVQKYIPVGANDDHYEFVSYQNRDENRFILNSILYLKPTPVTSDSDIRGTLNLSQGCTRSNPASCVRRQVGAQILPPVTSAKILSNMSFRYGNIEIKAKVPIGDWIYPQIELIPKNKLPSYPKILIAYTRGNRNLTFFDNSDIGNTLLFGGPSKTREEPERSRNLKSYRTVLPLGTDMRTYTLKWSPTRMDIMIDSQTYGTVFSTEYGDLNAEYQISLGVGVGGNYDFPDGLKSGSIQKPWENFNPKALLRFYQDRNLWSSTWRGDDAALQIESVKVWAV